MTPLSAARRSKGYALILAVGLALLGWLAWPGPAAADDADKSGVSPQVISLPSGPGSLEGLGESFEPDLATGTAGYPVKLVVPPGVAGFQPELTLTYNGGSPNGPWGLGWSLNVACIQRRTDAGLPNYDDARDDFIYNGEKLTPIGGGIYRLENEGEFMRFRRTPGGWEAHEPDGTRHVYGQTPAGRITNNHGVFRWCLEEQADTNGNVIRYRHRADRGNLYIEEISYNFGHGGRHNSVLFGYELRPDTFTDRVSRGRVTTALRGTEIQMWAVGRFVRAYRLGYTSESSTGRHSLLGSITQIGEDGISELPPTTFTYTEANPAVYRVVSMSNPPPIGLSSPDADLIDINYDGLPDVLYSPSNGHRYYLNRGGGRWQAEPIFPAESPADLLSNPGARLADMNGDGQADLLVKAGTSPSSPFYYYAAAPGRPWAAGDRVDYNLTPPFDLNDPNLQLFDANNDKRVDMMLTTPSLYYVWLAHDDDTWSAAADFTGPTPALGTPLTFSDPRVKLGDMTGDRLQDYVFVRDGLVIYYPYLGNGIYDTAVAMAGAPTGMGQRDRELQLGDLNNDGLDDIVLPGNRTVSYWLNLGDNSFAPAVHLNNTPALTAETAVRLADMDGDGSVELLFSRYPAPAGEIMQYVDFSTVTQPHLLRSIDNGMGRTYLLDYRPSTGEYTDAWDEGRPWATSLPFAVQVLARSTTIDANSGDNYVVEFDYRDGYYDGAQKEFRGFAVVTQTEHGDESAAATVTTYRYDTGAVEESRKGLVLEEIVMGEGGRCETPVVECYRRLVNQLVTEELFDGVAFSYVARTDTAVFENDDEPAHLRETFTKDEYGNLIEEFNYGRVCAGDVGCGQDERLTYTEYALNPERWIVNQPAVIRQRDDQGGFVSEERRYYDGDAYVGLPLGQVTRGNLSRRESGLGPLGDGRFIATSRQAFDPYGNVIGIMDANSNLTTVTYDPLVHTFPVAEHIHLGEGQLLTVVAVYHFGYGQITAGTDFNGNASFYTYDPFGRIERIVRPGDTLALPTQAFIYNLGSPRSSITTLERERSGEAAVRRSVTYYDGLGRALQTRREAEGGRFVVEEAKIFNARRADRFVFQPYFDDTFDYAPPSAALPYEAMEYDPLGRVLRTIHPDGTFVSTVYRPLTEVRYDEEDNTPDSAHFDTPHSYISDGLERLVGVEEINVVGGERQAYRTTYGYDLQDNLTRIVDAQGNVKAMQYDGLSRKIYLDDPDRGEMRYRYDDAGNLIETEDAKGQIVRYSYDAANRTTAEQWLQPDGSLHTYAHFHYDGDLSPDYPNAQNTMGQLAFVEDEAGRAFYSYDARGNPTIEGRAFVDENLTFITGMRYDATDRLVAITYPDGMVVEQRYNAQGLLESIPNFIDDLNYRASGQREQMAYTNGVLIDYAYDDRLRLVGLRATHNGDELQDLRYAFDGSNNVLSIVDGRPGRTPANDQTQAFTYDALYRLTGATGTYGAINHEYDSLGNMLRQTSTAADERLQLGQLVYGEDGAGPHAVTRVGGEFYRYDASGNLLAKGGTSYSWDHRDQLRAADGDGQDSIYTYDFAGKRVSQETESRGRSSITLYASRFAEFRDGRLIRYIWVDDQRIAQVSDPLPENRFLIGALFDNTAETLWFVADHLGGTSLMVDVAGMLWSEIVYYPFGLTRYESGATDVAYRFTGKELDASGLYYYETRYYDAAIGTFVSADALYTKNLSESERDPQKLNTYRYALNNPLRFTDPLGQSPWEKIKGMAGGLMTTVAGAAKVTSGIALSGTGAGAVVGAPMVAMGLFDIGLGVTTTAMAAVGVDTSNYPKSSADLATVAVSQGVGLDHKQTEMARAGTAIVEAVTGKYNAASSAQAGKMGKAAYEGVQSVVGYKDTLEHVNKAGSLDHSSRTTQRGIDGPAAQSQKGK